MASDRYRSALRQVHTAFAVGAVGGMSDGQLLDRFAAGRDGGEAAFEALVARHGPMVLGVCRQVLRDPHDAADAFQATFLVLVRRAGAIRKRESIGPWLHGVARRVSLRARTDAARRRVREAKGGVAEPTLAPNTEPAGDDLRRSLHEEIARLPEKYRAPVVLCDLEGRTHAEAASQLDWPVGTVSGRLSRARALLRTRIARRGLAFPAAVLVSTLAPRPVHAGLAARTARAAAALRSGDAGAVAPAVRALVRGVIRARIAAATGQAAALVLTAAASLTTVGLIADPAPGPGLIPRPMVAAATPPPAVAPIPTTPPPAPRRDVEPPVLALSPDGRTLASAGEDRAVHLWDMATCRETAALAGHAGPILSLQFTPDGRTLASAGEDCVVKVWDLASGQTVATLNYRRRADGVVVLAPVGPEPNPARAPLIGQAPLVVARTKT